METRPKGKSFWMVSFAAHASRGLIRDQGTRRKLMLGSVVVAVALATLGSTILKDALNPREHPVWFILFWLACAWMTVLALLLALFDLLLMRAQSRAAQKALRQNFTSSASSDSLTDDSA
jgi:hypothetical protein